MATPWWQQGQGQQDINAARLSPQYLQQQPQQYSVPGVTTTPPANNNWFNSDTMKGIGSAAGGLSSLAGIGMGFMQLRELKKSREQSQDNWNKNYESQRTLTNNEIRRHNENRRAQGRSSQGLTI